MKAIIDDVSKGPGIYGVDGPFEFNVFARDPINIAAAGGVGRINENVHGTLTIGPEGTWSFEGSYSLNGDRYNAGASNRVWPQEALPSFLESIGDTFGHADYDIEFFGDMPVHFTGRK